MIIKPENLTSYKPEAPEIRTLSKPESTSGKLVMWRAGKSGRKGGSRRILMNRSCKRAHDMCTLAQTCAHSHPTCAHPAASQNIPDHVLEGDYSRVIIASKDLRMGKS